jgi:PAS domain S-box-containing protein
MVLRRKITEQIREVLEKHPEGLSITDLVRSVDINRNTAGRYLENLLLSGQVEMRRFGMAKMYSLAKRLPLSSVLSLSPELVLQLDVGQRVIYANDPLLAFLKTPAKDLFGKNIEFTPFSIVFEDVFSELIDRFRRGFKGEEWHGELSRTIQERFFFCRVTPTVSNEGKKGVSVLLEDISDQKRDEERIRKSEARLRSIFRVSPVGIGVVANRILLEVNDRLCQMTGYSASELVGKSVRVLYPSEDEFDRVGTEQYNQIRTSGTGSIETRWVKKDGTIISILMGSTPLDPANISGGITCTAMDITERNQAEQALRESEDRYRTLAEASRDLIFLIGSDDRVDYVNSYAAAILHLPADQIIGKKRSSLFSGEMGHHQGEGLRRVFETGKTGRSEGVMEISGVLHWFDHYLMPITDTHGTVVSVLGVSRNITDRKRTENAFRESEDRYRKLVEISPDAVLLHRDGKIVYVNPAAIRLAGASGSDELMGKNILDIVAPEYCDSVRANITRDLAGETTPPMELRILRVDKKPVMVEGRGVSTFIDGSPAVLVALNDITERYLAGLALKKSEERYRSVFENTGAATAIVEENTIISLANGEFERLSGYTKREIEMKKSWTEFVVKKDLDRMLALHYLRRERGDAPRQYEFGFIRKNGDIRHVLITIDLIPGTNQTVASLIDFTDHKLAEEQLLQREQQYRFIADNSLDIINRQTPECICTYVSPAITPLLGYSEIEVLGKPVLALVHPDDIGRIRNDLMAIVQNGSSHVTSTFRFRHRNGHYLWFESTTKIIRDEKTGQIREFLSISRDITVRKSADDKKSAV